MARYKSTTTTSATLSITNLQQLKDYRDAQRELYVVVSKGNDDAALIRLLNAIPTLATLFKGTAGIGELASMLGGYAEEAADGQKTALLNGLWDGYLFFKEQEEAWDSNYPSMKVVVPMANLIDSTNNKRVSYIRGKGYVYSKTHKDGTVIMMS